jgi:hypothetical protein
VNAAPALSIWIAALLVAVGAALGGLAAWAWAPPRRRLSPLPKDWTLAARRVLNANERRVYNQLRLAFPKYIVLPKLPLVRLCQPDTPDQVKFWYELIGAAHVTFAVCNPNGHVLLVIDLDSTRSHSRRSTRIKESVLAACGIQRLHCAADELPSIDALRSLMTDQGQDSSVSESTSAFVTAPLMPPAVPPASEALSPPATSPDTRPGPATPPAMSAPASPDNRTAVAPHADRPATWQDPNVFLDSFFTGDDRPGSASESESRPELVDWPPVAGSSPHTDGAVVSDDEGDAQWRRAPVRLVGGR